MTPVTGEEGEVKHHGEGQAWSIIAFFLYHKLRPLLDTGWEKYNLKPRQLDVDVLKCKAGLEVGTLLGGNLCMMDEKKIPRFF